MGWTVFAGLESRVRANEKEWAERAALQRDARLVTDCVQSRGDVTERRTERAV